LNAELSDVRLIDELSPALPLNPVDVVVTNKPATPKTAQAASNFDVNKPRRQYLGRLSIERGGLEKWCGHRRLAKLASCQDLHKPTIRAMRWIGDLISRDAGAEKTLILMREA
jgi:hypothetical protein